MYETVSKLDTLAAELWRGRRSHRRSPGRSGDQSLGKEKNINDAYDDGQENWGIESKETGVEI